MRRGWPGALDRYLAGAGAGLDMDAALGLTPTPGAVAWWRARQQAERDRLLREAAEQYPGSTNAKAIQLQQKIEALCRDLVAA